jgi:hypothetical protein
MFPESSDPVPAPALQQLARTMSGPTTGMPVQSVVAGEAASAVAGDSRIPAGYTYLAQFIAHDLSFDPTPSLQQRVDVSTLNNLSVPGFDLDCVYGRGPLEQPYLYKQEDGSVRMLLGRVLGSLTAAPDKSTPRDVPRNVQVDSDNSQPSFSPPAGRALIGDPRNDEHVIISQLHAVFLRFHNCLADDLKQELKAEPAFETVQNQVRWHYQWMILRDFLPRIIDEETYDSVLPHVKAGTDIHHDPPCAPHYKPQGGPYIPVEFTDAAYRYGHSMIRGEYRLNSNNSPGVGGPFPILGTNLQSALTGLRAFADTWVVDWGFFFDGLPSSSQSLQKALKVNTFFRSELLHLPPAVTGGAPYSLPERDLDRAHTLRLPSGQQVATALGIDAMSDAMLFKHRPDLAPAFAGKTPLSYYVLAEAEQLREGEKLGPIGGRIVMETMVGLMVASPGSILSMDKPFQPRKQYCNAAGEFGMAELIKAAQADAAPRTV